MAGRHFLAALASPAATPVAQRHLVIARTGATLADTVEIAGHSDARRRGLLGRDALAAGTALVIAPCAAVHTFGMRFSIDVIFAARDGRVMKIARDLRPGRFAVAWGAFAAIEMVAGEASRRDLAIGDYVEVR